MSSLPSLAPERIALFPRGLRGAAPAPAPFYRQPHGLREVLSFADGSRFGRSASPTRRRQGSISKWAICTGRAGRAGRFGGVAIALPGLVRLVRPRHLVTFTGSAGSDFTQKPRWFLTLRLRPGREEVKADKDPPQVLCFFGGSSSPMKGTEARPSCWVCGHEHSPLGTAAAHL